MSSTPTYLLSAQPIDSDGAIGFDEPPADAPGGALECASTESVKDVMITMADRLADPDLAEFDCWDFTLSIRTTSPA